MMDIKSEYLKIYGFGIFDDGLTIKGANNQFLNNPKVISLRKKRK